MKLAAGILWVAIVIVSAFVQAFLLHLPTFAIVPWSVITALSAHIITHKVDYSQFYGVGVLSRLERFRPPVLLVAFPTSLICLVLVGSIPGAWTIGIAATLITLVIAISYTIKLQEKAGEQ